jgi:hypothetical protein
LWFSLLCLIAVFFCHVIGRKHFLLCGRVYGQGNITSGTQKVQLFSDISEEACYINTRNWGQARQQFVLIGGNISEHETFVNLIGIVTESA